MIRRMARMPIAGVAALTLALSACGGGGGGDEDAVASTVEEFMQAMANADVKTCDYGATDQDTKLKDDQAEYEKCKTSIESDPETYKTMMASLKDVKVTGADVDGDSAKVTKEHFDNVPKDVEYYFEKGFELTKIDGDWYVLP